MITIRSLIAGLMASLLAVISVATFLLVYFASLESVKSLTTLSVQTASDRIAGQISTTLLDRVTNPLVAVARAARVRAFTTPTDDPFSQNATSPDRFAWHGEWRTLFDDIVSGCPSCIMQIRFTDGSYGVSFPVPSQPYRYHQFSRSNGGASSTGTETFYDSVTYKLTLQTFDEVVDSSAVIYKPLLPTRVGSSQWNSVLQSVAQRGLALPASVPGIWTGADLTPSIYNKASEVAFRTDVIIANSSGVSGYIAIVSVYVPLKDVMASAEATVPTVNSRVFALNDKGIVTEVGHIPSITASIDSTKCSAPVDATSGCLPSVGSMNFAALTQATSDASFFDYCDPVRDTTTTGRTERAHDIITTDDGSVYFISPRCVDTPLDLSTLRVITLIPQDDINKDLTRGRDISIGIVVAFFIISLVFGYFFVWYLLKPFEVIAQRMKKAALLADNAPRSESSCLEEIARLQLAYETMNDELLRLKGFVPQSVLQLDMDDSGSGKGGPGGAYAVGENGEAANRDGAAVEMAGVGVPGSSSALFRRAHIMAERLSVSVASIQRSRVAVCVMNLRNFHGAIADMTTEDLSIAVKQIVRIISDATADHRGVVDFFHGDHYILTYGAARICHSPTKSAIATSLRVSHNLAVDSIIGQMKALGVPYATPAPIAADNNKQQETPGQDGFTPRANNNGSPLSKLVLSVGISAGEATVGSFGSTELKRFCTIGPCYSQAFEIELVLKDSAQLRKSVNTLHHSIGVPHWMFSHVFQNYRLEAVAMGLVTKTKTGIARVLGPIPPQAQSAQEVLFGQAHTPREEGNGYNNADPNNRDGPIEENGMVANSKNALEAFIEICNSDEPGTEERALAKMRSKDPSTTAVLEAIVSNYASEVSVNASPNEAQEEDVLHEAFASEEDWLDDGPGGDGNNAGGHDGDE